jgi:serine/threonine-protein kinase RsbW
MTTTTSQQGTPTSPAVPDTVLLRVPADPAYLAVLRTASAGLAARLDLTLDEIEDLRIAVDEACALLLGAPDPARIDHADISAVFTLSDSSLDVDVSGPARSLPERTSFAWAVLEALVEEVSTGTGPNGSWIRLRQSRAHRQP